MAAFLSNHRPFSLAMIMAVSGTVFVVIAAMFALYEACQSSEDSPCSLEGLSNFRITQRLSYNYCETEAETAGTGL